MPKLFLDGKRYEALSSTSLQELEYQALILQSAESLFPGLIVVPFTKVVYFEGVGNAADFAVIDPQYRRWWVIEVELAHHSLEGHVVPQVHTLANARYGLDEARWLAERADSLDEQSLIHMMQGAQPTVTVVVNMLQADWVTQLHPWAEVMIVELFRSDNDRLILRQNGVELDVPRDVLSSCHVDAVMPRLLVVDSPAPVLDRDEELLKIDYGGELTEWSLVVAMDKVWLSPVRSSPFPSERRLDLVQLPEDRLGLIPSDPSK
jgi:hypothetical protein